MMNCSELKDLIKQVEKTDSTNNLLSRQCQTEKTPEFTTIWAENQTYGKGQRGNTWESESGKNLTFSTVLYPTHINARNQFILSMLVSLAIHDVLSSYTDGISIKWPNDIYWKDKKICGVLIENELQGNEIAQSIIGIGVNVNQTVFRSLAPNPISLKLITAQEHDRKRLLQQILNTIYLYYEEIKRDKEKTFDQFHQRYMGHLYLRERTTFFHDANGIFRARIVATETDGHLLLKDEAGTIRRYAFKEVQYIH